MERLTDWINEEKTEVSIRHDRFRDAMIRLATYEDTGLEPCEIPVLLDRLKRASEQWNIWYDAYQKDVPEWIPVAERLPEETQVSEFPSMKLCIKNRTNAWLHSGQKKIFMWVSIILSMASGYRVMMLLPGCQNRNHLIHKTDISGRIGEMER